MLYPRIGLFVALSCVALSCGSADDTSAGVEEDAEVVVTTTIWNEIVSHVLCDGQATARLLMPAGADPHGFEPALTDRETLTTAKVIVANGGGLESGLTDLIEAAQGEGVPVVNMVDLVDTLSSDEDPDSVDPHVWFDPTRVAQALNPLADRLTSALDLESGALDGCVEAYGQSLADLDEKVAEMTSSLPEERKRLVTNHDSLAYFADRYGFDVIGTVIPSTSSLAEPNPAELDDLRAAIAEAGVPAIFSEVGHSDADAVALGADLGIEVVPLAIETLGPFDSPTATYEALIDNTATEITDALR